MSRVRPGPGRVRTEGPARPGPGPATARRGRRSAERSRPRPRGPGEAELVAVRVGEVEEALAPFGVAGGGARSVSRRACTLVECVDVGDVEDHAPPPAPALLRRLGDQV